MPYSTLEAMLAAALRQASREDRLDVAEHLLRALETLERVPRREGRVRANRASRNRCSDPAAAGFVIAGLPLQASAPRPR
jgi:hypothetical protein